MSDLRQLTWKLGTTGFDKAARDIDSVDKKLDSSKSKMTAWEANLKGFSKGAAGISAKLKGVSKSLGDFSSKMNKRFTVPIMAGVTASSMAALNWEDDFAGVAKTWRGTDADLAVLEGRLKDMAEAKPVSHGVLAGIAADAGQLGVEGVENVAKFTSAMADLDVATNLGANAAADMAQFMNIMDIDYGDIDRLGSSIVHLGNNSATTELDLFNMSMRLGSTGKIVGMSTTDVLGLATTMSSLGISAEAGGTSVSKAMQVINTEVSSGGKNVANFAKVAGVSSSEFATAWKEKPLEAFTMLMAGLDDTAKAGGDVAGTIKDLGFNDARQIDALQRLAGGWQDLSHYATMGADAWDENVALTEEAAVKYKTLKSQLEMTKNSLVNLGIEVGESLSPYIEKLNAGVKGLIERWKELSPETKDMILKGALAVAAIGPIAGVLKDVTGGVGGAIGIFGKLAEKLGSFKDMPSVFGALKSPALLAVAAIAGGAYLIYKNWDKVGPVIIGLKDKFMEFYNQVSPVVGAIASFIGEQLGSAFKLVGSILSGVVNVVIGVLGIIVGVITGDWDMVRSSTELAWGGIKTIVGGTLDFIKDKWNSLKSLLSKPIKGVINVGQNIIGGIKNFASNTIPQHKTGLDKVPYDGYLAELHKDEMVLTKSAANAYRTLGGTVNDAPVNTISHTKNYTNSSTSNRVSPDINIQVYVQGKEEEESGRSIAKQIRDELDIYFRDLQLQRV
jgi:TP901 family phage tail tape measure protein